MAAESFDVVTVPDFTGIVARSFEIRTLFFLASWLEYGGPSQDLPLHIACIGEPPESVRELAQHCNAEITIHSSEPQGSFANKLRGFEVNRRTDHLLLLDSDMLILSDISELVKKIAPVCIAATVANGPFPATKKCWSRIYRKLRIPLPKNQVIPLDIELDTFNSVPFRGRTEFPPLYNGGIVYAPWGVNLGDVWRDHLKRIVRISGGLMGWRNHVRRFGIPTNNMGPRARISNQPSLVTAIHHLQQLGVDFQLLPDEYHVRWQHLATGVLGTKTARLLHTVGFARQNVDKETVTAKQAVEAYHLVHLYHTKNVRAHRRKVEQTDQLSSPGPLEDCQRLNGILIDLYNKYVRQLMV